MNYDDCALLQAWDFQDQGDGSLILGHDISGQFVVVDVRSDVEVATQKRELYMQSILPLVDELPEGCCSSTLEEQALEVGPSELEKSHFFVEVCV